VFCKISSNDVQSDDNFHLHTHYQLIFLKDSIWWGKSNV